MILIPCPQFGLFMAWSVAGGVVLRTGVATLSDRLVSACRKRRRFRTLFLRDPWQQGARTVLRVRSRYKTATAGTN